MTTKNMLALVFHFLMRIPVIGLMVLAIWFAQKSKRRTTHMGQDGSVYPMVQRYVLPKWLNWFNTPDEDGFPMYERTIRRIYNRFGWRVTMYYNLALRNQFQGFLWSMGVPVTENFYIVNRTVRKKNPHPRPEDISDVVWDTRVSMFEAERSMSKLTSKRWDLKLFSVTFGWEVAKDHYKDYTKTGFIAIPNLSIEIN